MTHKTLEGLSPRASLVFDFYTRYIADRTTIRTPSGGCFRASSFYHIYLTIFKAFICTCEFRNSAKALDRGKFRYELNLKRIFLPFGKTLGKKENR